MDQVYRLIVDMSTRGSLIPESGKMDQATKKLKDAEKGFGAGLAGSLEKVGGKLKDAGSAISEAFTGAVEKAGTIAMTLGALGAAAGFGAVTYGVTKLNSELENTEVSLGAILNAQGMSSGLADGMRKAADVMVDMRRDAAALPGEFKDLIHFFQLGATPGFQSGASVKQFEGLAANAMATAGALNMQMDMAAREFAQLLQGRSGAHNVFGSMLGLTGEEASKFNALSGQERLAVLDKEMGKYKEARDVFGTTFEGLSSTLVDNGKKFLGEATLGLFERVKMALGDANRWFDDHEEQVMGFAESVGEKLVHAFDAVRFRIEEWTPAFMAFAHNAQEQMRRVWEIAEPYLERLEPMVKKALADPATFDRIEDILKAYAAVKVGSAAAPLVGSLYSGVSGVVGEGGLMGAMGLAGLPALGAAAAVAGGALVGAAGAVDILTDSTHEYHDAAMKMAGNISDNVGRTEKAFEEFITALRPVADYAGLKFTASLEMMTDAVTWMAEGWAFVAKELNYLTGGFFAKLRKDEEVKIDRTMQLGGAMMAMTGRAERNDPDKNRTPKVTGGGGTNIQKVEIVVSTNQDPSRIARLTVQEMAKLSRFHTSSRFVRNPSAVR